MTATLTTARRTAYCYDCGYVFEQCSCHLYPDYKSEPEPVAPGRAPRHDEFVGDVD